jgi:hypothetical protein
MAEARCYIIVHHPNGKAWAMEVDEYELDLFKGIPIERKTCECGRSTIERYLMPRYFQFEGEVKATKLFECMPDGVQLENELVENELLKEMREWEKKNDDDKNRDTRGEKNGEAATTI